MNMKGCTMYDVSLVIIAITAFFSSFTMGALTQDEGDDLSPLNADPFWLLGNSNLESPYLQLNRRDDVNTVDPDLLDLRRHLLPALYNRDAYNRIPDQSPIYMFKRGSLNELIRRLNALRGNPNKKKGTPRTTMMRFGGKRK